MESGFVESFGVFDVRILITLVVVIAARFYFKGVQFTEKVSAKRLVAVVTGANRGIGKQIVRELNIRGAKVYMLCQSEARASQGLTELVKLGCNPDRLVIKIVELTKFSTVHDAVKEISADEDHIDILINNAGVMLYPKFKITDDGHELVWQTNYLSHFLLTKLLLPLMSLAPAARIVNVSASAHYYSDPINLSTIDRRDGWDSRQSYAKSKLAMVMHAVELTKRLRSAEISNVTINSCHPGICYTHLMRYTPLSRTPLSYITAPLCWFFLKTPKDGAQTPLFLALSKALSGCSGLYYRECEQCASVTMDNWDEKCRELYEYSLNVCGLTDEY